MRTEKKFIYAIFSAATLLLFQCHRPTNQRLLVIAHPQTVSAIPIQLIAENTLAGYAIRLVPFQDHTLALAEFLRGETDLLFTGTTLGAAQAAKGVRLWRTPVWGTASIVVRPDFSLQSGNDLRVLQDRRVGLPFRGSPNDIQLRRLFGKKGIHTEPEYQAHIQATASLLAGRLDAAVLPEPLASKLVAEKKALRFAELAKLEEAEFPDEAPAPMVSLFVRPDLPGEKSALLPQLELRLNAALKQVRNGADTVAKARAAEFQVSPEILREGLRYTRFALPGRPIAEKRTRAFLRAAGILELPGDFFLP